MALTGATLGATRRRLPRGGRWASRIPPHAIHRPAHARLSSGIGFSKTLLSSLAAALGIKGRVLAKRLRAAAGAGDAARRSLQVSVVRASYVLAARRTNERFPGDVSPAVGCGGAA